MTSRSLTAWAAVLFSACLSAAPVAADTVNLTFDKTTKSAAVSVKVNGTSVTGTPGPYYWHESSPPSGSPYPNPTTTFCVELTQSISTGNTYTYTATALASQAGVTATEATLIEKLYGAHYDTAWNSSSFAGSDASTAFQLALWKLVYDQGSNLSLSSGKFTVTSASSNATNLAQQWLNGLSSVSNTAFDTNFAGYQLLWLSNSYKQDQLTLLPPQTITPPPPPHGVPAPAGLVLGLIGAGCLFGRTMRRRPV
jgi:hypothetical protein